jgi:Co/Zn/Cd efflux system component
LFAAVGVWLTHSGWPDILVGLALAALFLRSALHVLRESIRALRAIRTNSAIQPDNFN